MERRFLTPKETTQWCRDLIVCKRQTSAKRLRKILGLTFMRCESGSADKKKRRNYLKFVSQRTQE
jgi:hypothetical protein